MSKFNVGGLPWALGADVSNCATAQDVMKAADLDWSVAKCELVAKMPFRINANNELGEDAFSHNGSIYRDCPNAYATYRTDINYPLGIVKDKYEVVQNNDAFTFFNNAIGEGKAKWDKAACLNNGEKVYVSAKLPVQTSVGKGDIIDNYLVFSNGHAGNSSVDIMITPVRVICTNMLNGAIENASCHIRLRHTKSVKEKLELGAQVLKVACSHALDAQELYRHMATIKMSDEEVAEYLCRLQLTPAEVEKLIEVDPKHGFKRLVSRDYHIIEAVEISTRKSNQLYNMMDYYIDGIGQKDIAGSAWGAYNAVTGFYCNVANLEGEKRMNSLVWGSANNNMNKALNEAIAYAS
uniref:DUF932 domain-containing protein n=1 Tax=Geladintestivirus 3 TaxID=3233135 RepID=A0AAU8MHB2_9CAUD